MRVNGRTYASYLEFKQELKQLVSHAEVLFIIVYVSHLQSYL